MAARKASCSSRNFTYDGPMLPPAGRTGRGTVHESPAVATDVSSIVPATALKSNSILPSNATAAIKSNSTLPSNATSRLETSVMQSPWIQRLKPFAQAVNSEEELAKPPKKQSHVWTHFTKDFRSCSRRLTKASHHTRSSSWPPDGPPCKEIRLPHINLAEPAVIREQHHRPRVISPIFRDQNLCVPSENAVHSSDASSMTGNLFSSQQNGCKRASALEALVPCAQNRETSSVEKSSELRKGENGDGCKLEDFAAQHFQHLVKDNKVSSVAGVLVSQLMKPSLQPEIISESRALLKGASARVVGDVQARGEPFFSESVDRTDHIRGASADADDRIFLSSLLKDVNLFTPVVDFSNSHGVKMQNKKEPPRASLAKFDCEKAVPAVVLGNTVKKDRFGQTGLFDREILGNDLDMGSKPGGDFGFLHFGRNYKNQRQSAAKPYVSNGPCYGGASDRFCIGNWNCVMADASNRMQGKKVMAACAVGSSTVATTSRPSALEQSNEPRSFNVFCRRGTNLVSSNNPLHLKEELVNKMPFTSASLDEDVARSRIQEISLEEYWNSWVQHFEEPGPVKPEETGSSTASLPQEYILEEYCKNSLKSTANTMKCVATEKLEDFSSPSPHRLANADVENHSSCDLQQQNRVSSLKNYKMFSDHEKSLIQIKQTGWGQEHCASADRTSLDGLKSLKQSQEQNLHLYKGATARVAAQVHNEDPNLHPRLSNDGSTDSGMNFTHQVCEAFSTHQAWIQRWRSSANFRAMLGKASTLSCDTNGNLSSDLLVKLPVSSNTSALCTVAPSYKGKSNMGYFDHNLTESGRESNRHTEASGTHLNSAPGSSFPAGRSYDVSLRGNYMAPSVEAMAIVGTTASKLHTSSLQNRGSFSVWPCTSAKVLDSRGLSEHIKGTAEDKVHLVDMDDLDFLERHIG